MNDITKWCSTFFTVTHNPLLQTVLEITPREKELQSTEIAITNTSKKVGHIKLHAEQYLPSLIAKYAFCDLSQSE